MRVDVSIERFCELGLGPRTAQEAIDFLNAIPAATPPEELWKRVSRELLSPEWPHAVHLFLFQQIYRDRDRSLGPPPAWFPAEHEIASSNIAAFCRRVGLGSVHDLHRWSAERREDFWRAMIETLQIRFRRPPSDVVDLGPGVEAPGWLPGSKLNIAESCFQAEESSTAVVYQREGGAIETMTVGDLDRLSNRFANALVGLGLPRGSSVAIAMPMTVEAVAAYLGVIKAGCTVASIADSFAPDEIRTRLRISSAKTAVTQDVVHRAGKTLPMYEKVVAAGVERAIVAAAGDSLALDLRAGDIEWNDFLSPEGAFEAVVCGPDDPTNILFSSGTTGDPKAIPWTHTTPIKCAMDAYLHHDIHPGEIVAWPTSIGWMMGPWLIYASLMNRATMALHYGAPVTRDFCEFVQNARVRMLGVVPSLVKAWQMSGAVRGLDWSSIKLFSSTGECSNADDYLYLMSLARYRPVIEYCGGTEIGGGYISGTIVRPASPATFSSPSFGLDFHILDEDGKPTPSGELFIVPPSIGLSNTLLNKDHFEVYYAGTPRGAKGEVLRRHGDETEELPDGYYRGHGRADDTMNLGGIKVSSTEIERSLVGVEGVRETAAVAFDPPQGGPSVLVVYAVPEAGASLEVEPLKRAMQRAISSKLNPLFKIHDVVVVNALPRTASNKVMRRVLRTTYGKPGTSP